MAQSRFDQFREICLALPEAYEEETWGEATFRVRKKIFATASDHDGQETVCMKSLRDDQEAMLAQGSPFLWPRYVGSKGWIGVELSNEHLDWIEVKELVRESFRLVAPKSLSSTIEP